MRKDIKLVFEDSRILDVFRGTTVREVLRELDDEQIIALRVNGNAVDSDYELMEDAYINYITIHDRNILTFSRNPKCIIIMSFCKSNIIQ